MSTAYDFSIELQFTETYQKNQHEPRAILEAMCLQVMYPKILCAIEKGDMLAGRIKMSYVGFSPEPGGLGYYCNEEAIKAELSSCNNKELKDKVNEMVEFWKTENTSYKVRAAYPLHVSEALPSDNWTGEPGIGFPLYRMAGAYLDYKKLLDNGIGGMKELILQRKILAEKRGEDTNLFIGMDMALDVFSNCCLYYRDLAIKLTLQEQDSSVTKELYRMAAALEKVAFQKPETLMEAIQLSWLYSIISGAINYGRMDMYLGNYLVSDLEKKVLTLEQAQELLIGLWKLIAARNTTWNGRVILGGRGRENEENADKFAMLAMEASRVVKEIEPQLSLRFYKGMNNCLMEKALSVIGEGRTYPILYNDDINVDAVMQSFNVSRQEAEQYVPFGCGEYVLNHKSFGTPNGIINLLKALEAALFNGKDSLYGKQIGPKTGDLTAFESFDQLFEAYRKQVEYCISALAEQEEIEYRVVGETSPFLFYSMLYEDCIERGRGIFSGGIKYLGGTLESYGNINTSNSLFAIKDTVYDRKVINREQLLAALKANFKGYEKERRLLLNVPKYGNDCTEADEMAMMVHKHVCNAVREQIKRVLLHSYLVVIINNSANTTLGKLTGASADGRFKGQPMANANNPSGGSDTKGLTAMLNSLVKLDRNIHAGSVQNMKLSPELFRNNGIVVKSVLQTYFDKGGTQAMITVVDKKELENAMLEPEKYSHLFVRVGGFSARFVELERDVQLEILSRTHY
jgi:pyruvate-formate lyase